jgi:lysozyme
VTPDRDALKARLIREEALRLKAYIDPVGKVTVGVGRNLTDVGLSHDEAMYLLDNDLDRVITGLTVRGAPWFSGLDQVRQQVCCDMAFNLGVAGFFGFTTMVRCLAAGDFVLAAQAGRLSRWYTEVGMRAQVLMTMLESGLE